MKGQGIRKVGKRSIVNNFCIGIAGNKQACNRCHIGYGYGDAWFDLRTHTTYNPSACHDDGDIYMKAEAACANAVP